MAQKCDLPITNACSKCKVLCAAGTTILRETNKLSENDVYLCDKCYEEYYSLWKQFLDSYVAQEK